MPATYSRSPSKAGVALIQEPFAGCEERHLHRSFPLRLPNLLARPTIESSHDFELIVPGFRHEDAIPRDDRAGVTRSQGNGPFLREMLLGKISRPRRTDDLGHRDVARRRDEGYSGDNDC